MGMLVPHIRGPLPLPRGEQHTEEGRLCRDPSLLEASQLKCPLQPGEGMGRCLPGLMRKLALQGHDQLAWRGKRAPDMLLISVNLNFP